MTWMREPINFTRILFGISMVSGRFLFFTNTSNRSNLFLSQRIHRNLSGRFLFITNTSDRSNLFLSQRSDFRRIHRNLLPPRRLLKLSDAGDIRDRGSEATDHCCIGRTGGRGGRTGHHFCQCRNFIKGVERGVGGRHCISIFVTLNRYEVFICGWWQSSGLPKKSKKKEE